MATCVARRRPLPPISLMYAWKLKKIINIHIYDVWDKINLNRKKMLELEHEILTHEIGRMADEPYGAAEIAPIP